MSDRLETDILAELVERKLRVLVQLRELTVRQPSLIATDDMKTLLRVFAAKQKLLEEIQRLDSHLEPFRSQDPQERVWRSADLQIRCRGAAEQCRRLVEEIKAAEKRDKLDLIERRDTTARQLEEAHAAAAARTAYRPTIASGGFDIQSES
jgi:hypothetical protein